MPVQWTAFIPLALYTLSLLVSAGVTAVCWRYRAEPGALAYALLALSQTFATFGFILELISPSLTAKVFWDSVQYIGTGAWSLSLLAFAFSYSNAKPRRLWLIYSLVAIPLIATVVLSFATPLDGPMRAHSRVISGTPFDWLLYDFTNTVTLLVLYIYGLYLTSLALLLSAYRSASTLHRSQLRIVIVGTLIPILGTALTFTTLSDTPYRDLTPITFAISNAVVSWGLLRYRLFRVLPLARDLVVESMDDAVFVIDLHDRLVDLNKSARQILGAHAEGLIGRPSAEVFHPWPDLFRQYYGLTQANSEIIVEQDGEQRYINLRIQPARNQRGELMGSVVVARDLTEHRKLEEIIRRHHEQLEHLVAERTAALSLANQQLRDEIAGRERAEAQLVQAQKMEAIGRLTSGVAHDFNNLLTTIIGHTELLLLEPDMAQQMCDDLSQVLQAANHAAALTQQLLAFSRKQARQVQDVDIGLTVRQMEPLIRRLIGEHIEVTLNLATDIGWVRADPGQIQQVILNLVVNARDAMPNGGHLRIDLTHVPIDPTPALVRLIVTDTGIGMTPDILQHLFEPFFTTKAHGQGTGLGLATVYGIVAQSGGHIDVISTPGQGSTFTITLPEHAAEPQPKEGHANAPPARGHETILLVEDAAGVRNVIERSLREHGYVVLSAGSAEDAQAICAGHPHVIDLMLSDITLPTGMQGRTLGEELLRRGRVQRVIYMSGYPDGQLGRDDADTLDVPFIQKPFTPNSLLRLVAAALRA
jgi:PAS domain S-box-containing protein